MSSVAKCHECGEQFNLDTGHICKPSDFVRELKFMLAHTAAERDLLHERLRRLRRIIEGCPRCDPIEMGGPK